MKEDYLWDKTGSDPEIEKLENVLKTFRQQESIAPEITNQSFVFDKDNHTHRSPRRLFAFGIASFACLAVIVIGIAVFQMMRSSDAEIGRTDSTNGVDELNTNPATESVEGSEIQPAATEIENAADPEEKVGVETRRNRQAGKNVKRASRIRASSKTSAKINPLRNADDQEVILTKEEKYAYDQLMLGLSITSSNLKIVKDKANGISKIEIPKKVGS